MTEEGEQSHRDALRAEAQRARHASEELAVLTQLRKGQDQMVAALQRIEKRLTAHDRMMGGVPEEIAAILEQMRDDQQVSWTRIANGARLLMLGIAGVISALAAFIAAGTPAFSILMGK